MEGDSFGLNVLRPQKSSSVWLESMSGLVNKFRSA